MKMNRGNILFALQLCAVGVIALLAAQAVGKAMSQAAFDQVRATKFEAEQ